MRIELSEVTTTTTIGIVLSNSEFKAFKQQGEAIGLNQQRQWLASTNCLKNGF